MRRLDLARADRRNRAANQLRQLLSERQNLISSFPELASGRRAPMDLSRDRARNTGGIAEAKVPGSLRSRLVS